MELGFDFDMRDAPVTSSTTRVVLVVNGRDLAADVTMKGRRVGVTVVSDAGLGARAHAAMVDAMRRSSSVAWTNGLQVRGPVFKAGRSFAHRVGKRLRCGEIGGAA